MFGKNTFLRFSEPVFHGPENQMLGWVVMVSIEYNQERFMFAPDVQGPMSAHTLDLIREAKPEAIMIGGPPFYLGGFKVDEAQLQTGLRNLAGVVESVPLTILEHHALRDEQWQEKSKQLYDTAAKAGHTVLTAAEFTGQENKFLESRRKKLYADCPVSKEFEKWMRESSIAKSVIKPPI
jgi:predicted metallo-beta-lactamase superfamily hydrolase